VEPEADSSVQQIAISVPAEESSITVLPDGADIVGDTVSTDDTVTRAQLPGSLPASSSFNDDVQSNSSANEGKSIAIIMSTVAFTDDYDTSKSHTAESDDRTATLPTSTSAQSPNVTDADNNIGISATNKISAGDTSEKSIESNTVLRSTTRSDLTSTNSVNDAHSSSTDPAESTPSESTPSESTPSESIPSPSKSTLSDEFSHSSTKPCDHDVLSHQSPAILPDEFFLQCVFCFNEFEETDPVYLDVKNGSNVDSTGKETRCTTDSESKISKQTISDPSIITPCGHRFHIECLKKDCDLVLRQEKKTITTPQSDESKEELLMQCPHPFCQKNLTKSWALEKGLIIRIDDNTQNRNDNTEAEDATRLGFCLRNADTMRRVIHVFLCITGLTMIASIIVIVLAYEQVITAEKPNI